MSAVAVARSSLLTSLRRYQRSAGLWLILLVAPVGARFMVADESGKGVTIAIGDQLPVLTSAVLGVWLGIVVSTLLWPVGYVYLRSNVTRRQAWQVEEVTPASRIAILLGRFAADVSVLLGVLSTLTLAGWFLGWLMVSGPLNLWHITLTLWVVAAPALIGLAAVRIFFDAIPALRRGWGDGLFFILWMGAMIAPIAGSGKASSLSTNMFDFLGFVRPLVAGSPDGKDNFAIGGAELRPGRVSLDAMSGILADGYLASRAVWIGIAILLVVVAGLIYRPHKSGVGQGKAGLLSRLLDEGPPPSAAFTPPVPDLVRSPFPALIVAEFRLIGAGRLFKLLAAAAALSGVAADFRHIGSAAILLLLVFALSAHAGRSEARGLKGLLSTTWMPPVARRMAFVAAGVGWAMILGLPAIVASQSLAPLTLMLATGCVASVSAMALAAISGSAFAPRLVLLIVWYAYVSS